METLRSVFVSSGNNLKLNLMYMMEEEIRFLFELVNMAPAGPVVEIGCGYGASTSVFASAGREVCSVDIVFENNKAGSGDCEIFREVTKPFKNQITEIAGDSYKRGLEWDGTPIAFLFIDGNHKYEPVKKDIEVWTPHLMNGGIVAFHDYIFKPFKGHRGWHTDPRTGVVQAVNEMIDCNQDYGFHDHLCTIRAYKKH